MRIGLQQEPEGKVGEWCNVEKFGTRAYGKGTP